jgi:putative nucleotidyltransferase with HDIG domain
MERAFADARSGQPISAKALVPIVDGIMSSLTRNASAIPSILRLKKAHEYTYLHSVAVCGLMVGLAQEMRLEPAAVRDIGLGGLLHDIGKAMLPVEILDKPGPLTDAELTVMRTHPKMGEKLLVEAGGVPATAINICVMHHERMDGSGYPFGLAGDAISIPARMAAICDVYDALTSERTYKMRWSAAQAIDMMRSQPGQYDREILVHFVRMLGSFLPGALVRLRSNKLAIVLDDIGLDPLNPNVVAFHCALRQENLPWRRVCTESDPIISIERADRWTFGPDWPELRDQMMALSHLEHAA